MASDVMRVRLHRRQICVLAVVVDTPEELRVQVESTVRRPRCPHRGFKCHRVHNTSEREQTATAPWRPWDGSATSMRPASCPCER